MTSTNLHAKYSNYHYCIVRECKNTSIKSPEKLWIRVPSDTNMRNNWLKLAKRDPESISTAQIYFCEDHFNLENDMENYMEYKIMGAVKRIRMKPGCLPTRFECQTERKRKFSPADNLQHAIKKTSTSTISFEQELLNMEDVIPSSSCIENKADNLQHAIKKTSTSTVSFEQELLNMEDVIPSSSCIENKTHDKAVQVVQNNTQFCDQAVQVQPLYKHISCQATQHHAHKVIQVCLTKKYRSKLVQFNAPMKDAVSSPLHPIAHQSIATSPFRPSEERNNKPSGSGQATSRRKLVFKEEKYDSDVSYTLSLAGSSIDSSPSKPSSQTTVDSSLEKFTKVQGLNLQSTLSKIKRNPRLYIGIPAELYFIVDLITKHTNLSEKHILLCLMKVRLNRTFSQLADDFDISLSQASKVFYNKIPVIVSVLSPLIKTFTKNTIKMNLPIAFRLKYNKVNCIIDCLEIEIQKPKNAIHQALTWSEYKKANTYKYLLACTPDGLVSFVSSGYGGRISDVNLLEHSKFLDSLEPRSCILADRGFKHIEMYLKQRGFTLLRPPSVATGSKLTKSEAKVTKEIASLRIHVERVVRRIREFSILKPHAVVNLNLLDVLDYCVLTACALINLQDSLIK